MNPFAELMLPAVRWDPERGYDPAREGIAEALALGAGGFILFGGERDAVRRLTAELRAASRIPLLIASDLERGAGQQVRGLTGLPPLMGLATLGEDAVREAARLTAVEARDVGINWALGPVADLDAEADNPIVQTRAFGADPEEVGRLAAAWIEACQREGVLACAKHFPGHGRTTRDSHAELPVVAASRDALEADLAPFRSAVAAQVAAVMTAHVAYPALGGAGPATYAPAILTDLLRDRLGFQGLVVTDALIMEGALTGLTAGESAVRAIAAGCDLLCYPKDVAGVAAALEAEARSDAGFAAQAERARQRRLAGTGRAAAPRPLGGEVLARNHLRGAELARSTVTSLRGTPPRVRRGVDVEIVDDDAGGPYPLPPRTAFADELQALGIELKPRGERLVLLFADVKSWKGRAGLAAESRARLAALLAERATVVLFGHPRRLAEIPGGGSVLCAWSGDEAMQRAAARRLAGAP